MSETKKDVHETGALGHLLRNGHLKKSYSDVNNEIVQEKVIQPLNKDTIVDIDPTEILNWEFHDRPETELGDLETFARELKSIGQQQPCILRKSKTKGMYEVIVGERRWRAAKIAGIKLKAIIKELSDEEAALSQAGENSNRKDLSDYARGMSYAALIKAKILTVKDLEQKLSVSASSISRLLSYRDLPEELINEIGDMTKITPRTSAELKAILRSGDKKAMSALLQLAPKLRGGKLGEKKIRAEIEKICNGSITLNSSAREVRDLHGRHLFTWRKDGNNNQGISFPKNVREKINNEQFENELAKLVDKHIKM